MSLYIIGTLNPKARGLDFGPDGDPDKCTYLGYREGDDPTWFGAVITEPPTLTRDGKWRWTFVSEVRNYFPHPRLDDEIIAIDYEEWRRLILSEQLHTDLVVVAGSCLYPNLRDRVHQAWQRGEQPPQLPPAPEGEVMMIVAGPGQVVPIRVLPGDPFRPIVDENGNPVDNQRVNPWTRVPRHARGAHDDDVDEDDDDQDVEDDEARARREAEVRTEVLALEEIALEEWTPSSPIAPGDDRDDDDM